MLKVAQHDIVPVPGNWKMCVQHIIVGAYNSQLFWEMTNFDVYFEYKD